MSNTNRKTLQPSKSVKSVHNYIPRQLNHSRSKPSATSMTKKALSKDISEDLLIIYDYKSEQIVKALQSIVKTYYDDEQVARRLWRDECGRYIECQGLKLKPLHKIGQLLIKNGLFLVTYAQMLNIVSPDHEQDKVREHFVSKYAQTITKNTHSFSRFFGIVPKSGQPKAKHDKDSTLNQSKTPIRKQIEPLPTQNESKFYSLKRNPVDEPAIPSFRKSIPFKEFQKRTGLKLREGSISSSKKKSPMFANRPHVVDISQLQNDIITEAGIAAVYDDSLAIFSHMMNENYNDKDIFGVCVIFRKFMHQNLPLVAVMNLRNFQQADQQAIEAMRETQAMVYFKAPPERYEQYCKHQLEKK